MDDEPIERSRGPATTVLDPAQIGGNTRYYEAPFPAVEECVMVRVRSIADVGAYVTLLEYNNIEGMVLLSELSRRRIRSINRLIKVGRNEVVMVIRVDREKGYIDLSKRRVSAEDIVKAEDRFNKAKAVHSIVKHVSNTLKLPMLDVYTRLAWPLYKNYGHAYAGFSLAVTDPDAAFGGLALTPTERAEIVKYVASRMTPQPLKIRTDVQVTCFGYDGIEAVRDALLAGQALSTERIPLKVQLIAPPLYVMTTACLDKAAGIEALNEAIAAVKRVIEARGGQLNVKMAPCVTSAAEESELTRMLHDLELAAEEVSGDEDSDEDEAGEGSDADDGEAGLLAAAGVGAGVALDDDAAPDAAGTAVAGAGDAGGAAVAAGGAKKAAKSKG